MGVILRSIRYYWVASDRNGRRTGVSYVDISSVLKVTPSLLFLERKAVGSHMQTKHCEVQDPPPLPVLPTTICIRNAL